MYVNAISILLFFGKSTPAILATGFPPAHKFDMLSLPLLMLWIFADNSQQSAPFDDLALIADFFDR